MMRLAMTLARIRHLSLRLGWINIDARRCAASSDTVSSVALYALTVRSGVPTASELRDECKCLFALNSAVWDQYGGMMRAEEEEEEDDHRKGILNS